MQNLSVDVLDLVEVPDAGFNSDIHALRRVSGSFGKSLNEACIEANVGGVSMKVNAIICAAISDDIGSVELQQIELPEPGPGQVRVRPQSLRCEFSRFVDDPREISV